MIYHPDTLVKCRYCNSFLVWKLSAIHILFNNVIEYAQTDNKQNWSVHTHIPAIKSWNDKTISIECCTKQIAKGDMLLCVGCRLQLWTSKYKYLLQLREKKRLSEIIYRWSKHNKFIVSVSKFMFRVVWWTRTVLQFLFKELPIKLKLLKLTFYPHSNS